MRSYKLMRNLISIVFTCCVCGIYLILYMWHIFNQIDQLPKSERYIRWIIETEEVESIVPMTIIPKVAVEEDMRKIEESRNQSIKIVGEGLTKTSGVFMGPSGKETWYNLPMGNVVKTMRSLGYTESAYPYSIRDDGVKTLGDYVMVATDLNEYNKGDLIETSLGTGIICDTGDFTEVGDVKVDIATNW